MPFIRHKGFVVLDGGLGTSLESEGVDLDDPLWSAKVLLQDTAALWRVHDGFLRAGADIIATCTYQATVPGLVRAGVDAADAPALIEAAVAIAVQARDAFVSGEKANGHLEHTRRLSPLVAASIGPYGAYLADGSEYSGHYDLNQTDLEAFHRDRWQILTSSRADLLALETIPSLTEVAALGQLLSDTPDRWAWISFSCRDDRHLADGTPLPEVFRLVEQIPNVAGVGANCVAPDLATSLVNVLVDHTDLPVLLYPNSGESYDASDKSWSGAPNRSLAELAEGWLGAGVTCLGGCCRTSYADIKALRQVLERSRTD